ncbi:MAG TPA: lytic transglycosylase domain-containing protein [Acidobacteriaceae bacterium]|jgi:soluble lytic murein transglycosylase-like protein|nr:lytic transglycosylase domain-containing protein [Acidobacteriaceae bacterium]
MEYGSGGVAVCETLDGSLGAVLRLLFQRFLILPLFLGMLAFADSARASEHVVLRNGFSYDCARQQPLPDGRVRLFLASSDASYIDLAADQIESITSLPDDPKPQLVAGKNEGTEVSVHDLLARAGEEHHIDVELLASIIHAESDGRSSAVSHAGAQGLMQLMPETARSLGVHDSFRPSENVNGGTAYLDMLLTRYKDDLALALAAYNAGPGAVDRYHGVPPFRETRAYVARVMTEFKRRKLQLARGSASSVNVRHSNTVAGLH